METTESTEGSASRTFDVQPSSEGLETTSEPIPSSGSTPRSTVPPALRAGAPVQYSVLTEPSSDSLYEATCPASHQRGHGFGFQPFYVSCIPQDPCNTGDLGSSPDPTSSYPCHSSVHGSGSGTCCGLAQSSEPSQGSGPTSGPAPASGPSLVSGPGSASGPDSSASGPALAPGPGPADSGPGHKLGTCIPQGYKCAPIDLIPDYNAWCQHLHWKPQHSWEPLQVSEPGVRGPCSPPEPVVICPCKPPEVESEEILCKTRPRGQCLLYNWEEERATNDLDQTPPLQDGSESYFFRHGHRGLLSLQFQSPMSSSTTHRDSYQLPRHACQPLRGKREAMLETLLHHQICKEVQTEQEPERKLFETESIAHHDYRVELVGAGPPAPTKPHDYRQEQPETFWIQQAARLPGVSYIRTLDTPFRKNCSFTTPVPLSLGQPLPYELEDSPHQMGVMSSLACQGGGQGCGR
ncbi:sperm-associated antigen 8 [Apodemus sylvaticus]|uniref:sperm-associated antigen 8 n=1 Tax=Apodemus sylvaticus TaxID=10129 RepID=UPI002244E7D6|nr:sperm-associated antigen 8 [Apodemus sylvaticus]